MSLPTTHSVPQSTRKVETMNDHGQSAARIKVGDFVRVKSGPAYIKGHTIKGRVVEVVPSADSSVTAIMVHTLSGGVWGFNAGDLKVVAPW